MCVVICGNIYYYEFIAMIDYIYIYYVLYIRTPKILSMFFFFVQFYILIVDGH